MLTLSPVNISFADPNFIKSGRIDLLIGVDIIPQLMLRDIRKGTFAEPIAQNTQLGWIVFEPAEAAQTTSISIRCNLANLNNMVQRFFELDQVLRQNNSVQRRNGVNTIFNKLISVSRMGNI